MKYSFGWMAAAGRSQKAKGKSGTGFQPAE
jgi:hypothetical protein